jgi:hypothetical protein
MALLSIPDPVARLCLDLIRLAFMTEERLQFVIDQILKLSASVAGRSEPKEIAR